MSKSSNIRAVSGRSAWGLGLLALLAGIALLRPGFSGSEDGTPAESRSSTAGERSEAIEHHILSDRDQPKGRERSDGAVSRASEEIASSLREIEEAAAEADLMAFMLLVGRISFTSSVRVREGILTALASRDSDPMDSEFRDYALGAFASRLAEHYRVDEMLRVVDLSTAEGRLSWEKYLTERAGRSALEVIAIRPDTELFVESAHVRASGTLAAALPSRFRSAVEDGTVNPGTRAFDVGVRQLLRHDSIRCSEWLNSFPEDSPHRREGFTLVAEWLREIGRHEEAERLQSAR